MLALQPASHVLVHAAVQGPPGITHAQPVGILLQLLLGCGEASERLATLQALQSAMGTAPQTVAVVHKQRIGRSRSNVYV